MTTNIISLDENDAIAAASRLLSRCGFRALPIVGKGNIVKGAIPYRDIMQLSHRLV
jgi:CBS domain-containing protein